MAASDNSDRSSTSRVTLSIIVPVKDGGENFRICLQGLARAAYPAAEIIVVADGESDGSWRMAEALGSRVVNLPETLGPARARNEGARIARGDILFFIDADVLLPQEAVCQVEEAFNRDPRLAALFGSYDDQPEEKNFLSQYKNLFHHYVHQGAQEEASTFWAGCGAVRSRIFQELGGFNESYRKPCIEDIELGYRLRKAGYRIRLFKKLQVKHLKRWTIRNLLKSDFFDRALPWTELILQNRRFINDLNLRVSHRLSVLWACLFVSTLIGGSIWKGSFGFAGLFAVLLFLINIPVYRFFLRKRGFRFMIGTIAWHWLYYFYSGLAFAIGFVRFLFSKFKPSHIALAPISKKLPETVQFTE